jgi:hypothetical protein
MLIVKPTEKSRKICIILILILKIYCENVGDWKWLGIMSDDVEGGGD